MHMAKTKAPTNQKTTYQLFPDNPRFISDDEVLALSESMGEFGSLDGIVVNTSPGKYEGAIISGNQKVKIIGLENLKPAIIERLETPSISGTVGFGYVEHKGEQFPYREVYWSEKKCEIGNIRANNFGGHNDPTMLRLFPEDVLKQSGIDLKYQDAIFDLMQNFVETPDISSNRESERFQIPELAKGHDDQDEESGGEESGEGSLDEGKMYGSQEGFTTFTIVIPIELNEKMKQVFSFIKQETKLETTHECLNEVLDYYTKGKGQ